MQIINKVLILCLSIYSVSCTTIDKEEIDNLNGGEIMVIGHGGLGFPSIVLPFNPYPPNGFTALRKAIEYGADGLEVDVQMTKDSILVLFHDYSLESTTPIEGCIRDMTWEELNNTPFKLGAFYDIFQDDNIIRLDSLLAWASTLPEYPNLQFDMRAYNKCNAENAYADYDVLAGKLVEDLDRYNVPSQKVRIISMNKSLLTFLMDGDCVYPLSFEITERLDEYFKWVIENGMTSVTVKPKLLTKEVVQDFHNQDVEVITFGAKSYSGNVDLVRLNPDIIQTNNVQALRGVLKR